MREGQQQCAVLVRVSNVGELTRGGDKKRSGVAHYSPPPPAMMLKTSSVYHNGKDTGVTCTVYMAKLVKCTR